MAITQLVPHLIVDDGEAAIAFYRKAFGAEESFRLNEPSGRIGHAELDFGGVPMMMAEEFPEMGQLGPARVGGTSVTLHLQVDDADAVVAAAVAAGATVEMAVQDWFYGQRSGTVVDPFGHRWMIGHPIEAVDPEEMQRRFSRLFEEA